MKIIALFIFLLITTNLHAIDNYKKIDLLGLKIFNSNKLINKLNLNKLPIKKIHYVKISNKIINYYKEKGYPLAVTYLINETADYLSIFIDEGQLGQIKLLNLNSVETLRMRYELDLSQKIYNPAKLEKKLNRIKKKYNFSKIDFKLQKSIDYSKFTFQIDHIFAILYPKETSFIFFDKYGYRYNLDIHFYKKNSKKENGFRYGIKLSKSDGFCPFINYNHYSLFFDDDKYFAEASIGIFYLFNLKLKEHPYLSYLSFENKYSLPPFLNKILVPHITGSTYRSKSSRNDLGLKHYEYLKNRASFEPEFNFLKKISIYSGPGIEKIYIYNSEQDIEAEYSIDVIKHIDYWKFWDSKVYFKPYNQLTKLKFSAQHTHYFNVTKFNEINFNAELKIYSQRLSLFKTKIEGLKCWGEIPFHHEISVYNSVFKGFMGKGFHTHKTIRMENSFRTSIYKDYLFIGGFLGSIYFEGSGYDLEGEQRGLVAGPSFHLIFLDQFQFEIYYGKDYLLSQKESQYNLLLYLSKRW